MSDAASAPAPDPTDREPTEPRPHPVLSRFSEPARAWFSTTFAAPTPAQAQGWPAIAAGEHTLILAPTGSGKTLTAFLWAIDRLTSTPPPPKEQRLRVVYVSPLRALAVDVDRNLRAPLEGIRLAAERLGVRVHRPTVGVRTGDTPQSERERLRRTPPDILITTPESLYLMLTSRARETLRNVEAVIVDEIHAMAPTKRGSHLALTLERLEHEVVTGSRGDAASGPDRDAGTPRHAPQRIALSATQRPLEEIARFLGGYQRGDLPPSGGATDLVVGAGKGEGEGDPPSRRPRPVTIVDAGVQKELDLEVVVPVQDMGDLGAPIELGRDLDLATGPAAAAPPRRSIWPAVHPPLLDRILEHRSTLVFVNARRMAERLAASLNELYGQRLHEQRLRERGLTGAELEAALEEPPDGPPPELVKAHHGSLSRERRLEVEDELKSGRLRALVATSSLELGIDMGAVDLVVQVSSPGAVSRGLQRIGRAGHQVGQPSRGTLFPKFRGDLVEVAVVTRRMRDGDIEATRYPRNPLDVLAQQIVAMAAMDEWPVDHLADVIRCAAPFSELSDEVLDAVLDLLAGRYPSEEFAELRPRIVWDRVAGTIRARAGAQRLAVTNPGTIPDRGLFGVFLPDGTRVGELDEEMVHESRAGETFVLGASTWRIEDITHERVVVTPAPGEPGKLPFWHGDGPGRPYELGRAIGAFQRQVRAAAEDDRDAEVARLRTEHDLDEWAADNLVGYLEEQVQVAGSVPDDRTIVVERFRDELGDWRVCVLSTFGARVHAPWAMAIERRLTALGYDPEIMWTDDGIVLRLQETFGADSGAVPDEPVPVDDLLIDPDEVEQLVVDQLAGTALFTTLFREAAGRALLLPKRMPGKRTALWQQRLRAAGLLQVASRYPTFPLLLEATRESLQDVFDLPALKQLLADLQARRIRVTSVETASASPFAQSLLFGWVGQYMYEYDAPLAERRAAALSLDRDLLRELLGGDELRELLDADVIAALERELQRLPAQAAPDAPDQGSAQDDAPPLDRRARDADELHDALRQLGDLTRDELAARSVGDPSGWIDALVAERRAIEVRVGGQPRVAAAEDAARLRDAIGVSLPPGLPQAFTDPVDDPLGDLVARFARTHGPFTVHDCAARLALPAERVLATLRWLERQDRVLEGEFRPGGVGREWVDADVLRRLKRRSLAALRAEVEPVDAAALGRFLPAWQQVRAATGRRQRRGMDALLETVGQLQGAPIPASVLEADVLPARIDGYRPSDLDHLIAAGEVVWLGVEPLGRADGRVIVCFRDQVPLLLPPPAVTRSGATPILDGDGARAASAHPSAEDARRAMEPPQATDDPQAADTDGDGTRSPDAALAPGAAPPGGADRAVGTVPGAEHDEQAAVQDALRRHLRERGASFWPELLQAAAVPDQELVLDALWDLVWAGEVTNDTYAPVRALVQGGSRRPTPRSGRGRARPGRLTRLGPPAAQGRWSSTDPLRGSDVSPTERTHALTEQLLDRHGVLTRESLRNEAVPGGFSAIYPVLKASEEAGRIRRGYLVAGLGAAQFAAPGAAERLRDERRSGDEPVVVLLAATDPAQPYGAALPWPDTPGRPSRVAGAFVLLVDGTPAVLLERGGRSLVTFDHARDPGTWLDALVALVRDGRLRKLEISRVDGQPVHDRAPWPALLEAAGFQPGYRGFTVRG